jgi:hypothetical protein
MPQGSKILGQPINEEKWAEAKKRAAEEGQAGNYAIIMDIYKKMSHLGEFKEEHIAERRKKKQKLPDWREKKWDIKRRQLKTPVKKSLRLVIAHGGELDEFRCGVCKALLFKGFHLEKSMIEVKCRRCGAFLVSEALAGTP